MYVGNPYRVLGVSDGTSKDECKKVYRLLCRKYHPDNGGDADKYNAVVQAYKAIETDEYIKQQSVVRHRLTHTSILSYAVV